MSSGDQVLEKLLDEVDVGHDHAAAAVAVQAKRVHGITKSLSVSGEENPGDGIFAYPSTICSSTSFSKRSQMSPITCDAVSKDHSLGLWKEFTLPQEKQRTGMIMVARFGASEVVGVSI